VRFFVYIFFLSAALATKGFSGVPEPDAAFGVTIQHGAEEKDFNGPADTVHITHRAFSASAMEELKNDRRFNYKQPPTIVESLWDRFKQWISWIILSLFGAATTTDLGIILLYTLAIVVIIVIIMTLLRVNAFQVFYGSGQPPIRQGVFHENIHEMDFEALLREALGKKEFRLATRLVFLHALKLLSDKHLIAFDSGKTNHDYVEELAAGKLKEGFEVLSYYFDYAWYGDFPVSEMQFQKIRAVFEQWQEHLTR
jgi:hypothetical protein